MFFRQRDHQVGGAFLGLCEHGFTWGKADEDYVIYPDGSRYEIELLEDDVRFGDAV